MKLLAILRRYWEQLISIDKYDLCIVIGNILENAIEAVERVPMGEKRIVHLKIWTKTRSLFIHMQNSCVFMESSGKIVMKGIEARGIGFINVKNVVEKYGGFFHFQHTKNRFETHIMLPFGESNEINNVI